MMYNIIIPTLEKPHLKDCIDSIHQYTGDFSYNIHLSKKGNTWAEAVNFGIERFPNEDVILMDDDVKVTEGWLDNIEMYKQDADIIGWTLQRPNGTIQFAGSYLYNNNGTYYMDNFREPISSSRFVMNTTTSCVYIKREVFNKIGLMDNETYKEGCHYEDSDFCMRSKKAGFSISVIPEIVIHHETLTKKDFKNFKMRVARNGQIFYDKLNNDKDYLKILKNEGFI